MPTEKPSIKLPPYAGQVKYTSEIEQLKTPNWLVFDALRDGPLKANKKTAAEFEVLSIDTLQKAAFKLVKKGLANVNDGIFTMSKYGKQQIIGKYTRSELKQSKMGKLK